MNEIVVNRNGIDELVEYPNEEAKRKFLLENENKEVSGKHVCKNDLLRVKNQFFSDGHEVIKVFLDCFCDEDKFETVVIFEDNSLIKAKDNFKGWLSSVLSYLIQNDYQIIDERSYNYED